MILQASYIVKQQLRLNFSRNHQLMYEIKGGKDTKMMGGEKMEKKPNHYDGSVQPEYISNNEPNSKESFQITDEIRPNIGGNPYFFDMNK